ncbi:MAG: HlyD family secretion protein [Gemmataceae bacterium]
MKVIPIILILGGALAGTGMSVVLRGDGGQAPTHNLKAASAVSAQVAANGVVEGAQPEVSIRPEIAGTITNIFFRENHSVKKGDLLIELQNDSQKEQVALTKAEVTIAKATLDRLINGERPERRRAVAAIEKSKLALAEQAKADYDRGKRLGNGQISKEQLDADYFKMLRAQAEYDSAKAEKELVEAPAQVDEVNAAKGRVESAQAKLRLAESELAKTRLVAPCNGTVLQVYAEPGEMAGPTSVQPVLIMADLSKRRIRAFVEELDASRVKTGQRVTIDADALPGRELTGVVAITVPRMGKRSLQSDAPGEYKDLYYRETLIDVDGQDDLPPNLRVRVLIDAK